MSFQVGTDVGGTFTGLWVRSDDGRQAVLKSPSMLFAAQELLESTPDPTDEETKVALRGNLCRCTGYQNIVRAVRRAADHYGDGHDRQRLLELDLPSRP